MTPDRRSVFGALRERWASLLDVGPFDGKQIALALAFAALGFVVTGLIAFAGSGSRGQPVAVQTVNVPGPTVYATPSASSAPQPANTAQPSGVVATAGTVAPSTTTAPPAPQHAIWHHGDVTITPEAGADLDAPAYDRSWGQLANGKNLLTNGGPYDVWWRGGILSIDPINRQGMRIKAAPTFETCQNPGYSNDPTTAAAIGPVQLRTGYVFCVQTDGGRLAVLSYKSLPGGSVQLHVTTWAKDGD